MRIITFNILGQDETHTATIQGQTKAEATGNAIRATAADPHTRSIQWTIGRKATAAERDTLPTIQDALRDN